ncbi:TlpA disulfide reductase family protein [Dysgonomonas sp. 25]|uniref:TlpA family protein disulfide reductase n=1 Tax=Dysgonomonas sp. 25 TaxID=2302933 RepID=UPI0013D267FE|nr:TlpA disulfide reductase family protein [Dysgonomonas sp. 25]NDV68061.1 TlpA family protein disulfide reductase [Dysgonomonas sp. 25]
MKHILIALSALFLIACNSKNAQQEESPKEETASPKSSGTITVIVSPDVQSYYAMPSLSLYNGFFNERIYGVTSTTDEKRYNMEIYVPEGMLSYFHRDGYSYSYIVHPDDTIRITFENDVPIALSTDKKQSQHDLNWFAYYNSKELQAPEFKEYRVSTTFNDAKRHKMILDYHNLNPSKRAFLNTLKDEKLISADRYQLANKEIALDSIRTETNKKDYIFDSFDDDNLNFDSYRMSVHSYIFKYFGKRTAPSKVFEKLLADEKVTPKTKLSFLYNILGEIGQEQSTEFKNYAEIFLAQTNGDNTWLKLVEDISPLQTIDSKDMQLYDMNMQQVDFANLMNTYKGKVVYIDVWASWCSPCLAAMPSAKEIREKYKNKDVVFLYLAYNDQEKAWKKKAEENSLNVDNAKSYLIASPNAQWVKDMNLKSIPRYMIYDKNGKLVSKDAPNPKNEKLIETIDSLL